MIYSVEVIIENKKSARDPEGETIYTQLVLKKGFKQVESVRSGKYLRFKVDAENMESAIELVREICSRLRIYNPAIHDIEVRPYPKHGSYKVSRN